MNQARSGFSDVDRSADPAAFVRFLDERAGSQFFIENRLLRLERLALQPGDQILEVGCGTGEFTRTLRAAVGESGSVVGLDASDVMVATAQQRSAALRVAPAYCVGDACRLAFRDATFDACTTERVLLHLEDPSRAVSEMARVTRTGGRITVFEPDWGTMAINAPGRALTEKVLSLYADRLASPWVARRLPGMFRNAGLADVTVAASTLVNTQRAESRTGGMASAIEAAVRSGALGRDEAASWGASVREAAGSGGYFFSLTFFLVSGRKV
jgi:ubiquinone/menaquinone biosynthesis C-methylase UbiE